MHKAQKRGGIHKKQHNYAFIDGQNLNLGIRELGWHLDFERFRVYLREKYGVERAYYFIGYLEENRNLYKFLQEVGYVLVFKPIVRDSDGKAKGNVDADLVLQAMIDFPEKVNWRTKNERALPGDETPRNALP